MLRFVWPLLLCLAIPASAWMGPVLVGGTVPAAAPSGGAVGTLSEWTTSTGTLNQSYLVYVGGTAAPPGDSTYLQGLATGDVSYCHIHAYGWSSSAVGIGIYTYDSGTTFALQAEGNASVTASDAIATIQLSSSYGVTEDAYYLIGIASTDTSWSLYRGADTPTRNIKEVSHTYNGSSMPASVDVSGALSVASGNSFQVYCSNSATPPW